MTERSSRFRRLAPGETADLFEHYGVEVDPRRAPAPGATTPMEARPCRGCGWYVTSRQAASACSICADPSPWAEAPSGAETR